MNYWLLLGVFSLTAISILGLIQTRLSNFALDKPNDRSLHTKLTPRTGGVAIMAGVMGGWLLLKIPAYWFGLPLALISLSLIDDVKGLSARWRFLGQSMVCAAFLFIQANTVEPWLVALLLIAMVWMVNLYNFMDGSDGLAGGMAIFGFSAYGIAAYSGLDIKLAMMSGIIVFSGLAFLLFNFNPAKIFMGDSGSIPLGFLAAALGLVGYQRGLWPFWFPIAVFSPFIVDATLTLLKRLFKGEKIWQAHRSHYYQRLVQMGMGHRKTALLEYCVMVFMAASALLGLYHSAIVAALFVCWIAIYGLIIWIIDHKWRNFSA